MVAIILTVLAIAIVIILVVLCVSGFSSGVKEMNAMIAGEWKEEDIPTEAERLQELNRRKTALRNSPEGRAHLANCEKGNHVFELLSKKDVQTCGYYEIDSHGDSEFVSCGHTDSRYRCKYCNLEKTETEEYDTTSDSAYQTSID